MNVKNDAFQNLAQEIHACTQCERLRAHCLSTAREKRKSYQNETYWGRPISGFGDPRARIWIVGLAPAAHGANRTGRIFTGDRSGDWLYRALHKAGLANQPTSTHIDDGLMLYDTFISCVVRCAPPGNAPAPDEARRCLGFLRQERDLLDRKQVVIALGGFALKWISPELHQPNAPMAKAPKIPTFRHSLEVEVSPGLTLLASYHPSQQNTFTKRLTEPMFDAIFARAKALLRPI